MSPFENLTNFDSVLAILSRISLFGGTSEDQLQQILRRLQCTEARQGEYIFRRGDDPFYIYILKSGKLELQLAEEDSIMEVHEVGVGECFGEASIMSMHKHTISAVAREDSELMVLSRHCLISLRHDNIELFALLMMNISRELARRLSATDARLLHYMRTNGQHTVVQGT